MKGIILGLVIVLLLWEVVLLPEYVARKISLIINEQGGEIINIKLISRRGCIFKVTYLNKGITVTENIKYGLLGKIDWI